MLLCSYFVYKKSEFCLCIPTKPITYSSLFGRKPCPNNVSWPHASRLYILHTAPITGYSISRILKAFLMPVDKSDGRKISREEGNGKKTEKKALFSLYLLYLYHVWKSRGSTPPCPPLPTPIPVEMRLTLSISDNKIKYNKP